MTEPSLRTIVKRALRAWTDLQDARILVAVSGGPDSMALLDVMTSLHGEVVAHGVDHGLRTEARAELDLAEALARDRGVTFSRSRVKVARGGNLQARAREARWKALVLAARKSDARAIATAHHADDRAETMLIRLLQGSGTRGLAVMPPRAPVAGARELEVVRPLLRARKRDVLTHLERHSVTYARDPSNEDPRYLRTRVRRELLPLLESLDGGIVGHLEALADELCAPGRPAEAQPSWPFALPRRTQLAIQALLGSGSRTARVWLPGGLVLSRDGRARSRGDKSPKVSRSGESRPR